MFAFLFLRLFLLIYLRVVPFFLVVTLSVLVLSRIVKTQATAFVILIVILVGHFSSPFLVALSVSTQIVVTIFDSRGPLILSVHFLQALCLIHITLVSELLFGEITCALSVQSRNRRGMLLLRFAEAVLGNMLSSKRLVVSNLLSRASIFIGYFALFLCRVVFIFWERNSISGLNIDGTTSHPTVVR